MLVALLLSLQDPEAGLAVHVGSHDGLREVEIAASGRFLVHGLARDAEARERARAAIRAKGLYPLASVELWQGPSLPYADNLVNLLVSDQALPKEEVLRVLCPGGVARVGRERLVKPRPDDIDDWTHFDHGPDGNGVSRDRRVRPPRFVQWTSGVQEIKLGGNPAGFVNLSGIRVADGRAVFDYQSGRQAFLTARDAWNGIPLWTSSRQPASAHRRWQLVATGGRIYTFVDGRLAALDAAGGKPILAFDKAGARLPEEGTQLRVGTETLLVNLDDGLHAFHPRTAAHLWTYREEGRVLAFPALAEKEGRAFAAVVAPTDRLRSRWPSAPAEAVVCLDARTGQLLWRNVEVAGKPVGQLIPADGLLALFAGSAIGGRQKEGGWVSAIVDGKLLGQGSFVSAYNDSMYNALVRDGAIWYAGHTSLYRFDPRPGTITRMANLAYNQRCNRFTATEELWLIGYITYLNKDLNGVLQTPARAGCALGTTPANGMLYLTPSACNCFTQLRGYQALSPEPLRTSTPSHPERGGPDTSRALAPPAGPIPDDWTRGLTRTETEAVEVDGLRLIARIHEHRVEAKRGNDVVWSATAGGRVSHAPLILGRTAYFGSHDGWVYAVSTADGALRWRNRAAPYERKTVAYGQLESSWPVYGVVEHQGRIVASAGTHPELGGGVVVSAFHPETGELDWRRTLAKPHATITTAGGKSKGAIVPQSFLNEAPAADGPRLRIGAFSFDPAESDEDLRTRLGTPPLKSR